MIDLMASKKLLLITLNNTDSPHRCSDRNELEAAQKFLEQAAIENLVSISMSVWV